MSSNGRVGVFDIFIFVWERMVKKERCVLSGEEFDISDAALAMYESLTPIIGEKKLSIPMPTLCPKERQRKRMAFRNEGLLYRGICSATQQPIISMYSPESPYVVYDQRIRWGDGWSGLEYGIEFDFSKTFTEQFQTLMLSVPRMSLINKGSVNSDYCNPGLNNQDCYLVYSVSNSNNCSYGRWVDDCQDCFDCLCIKECRECYFLIGSKNCYSCKMGVNLIDCSYCINCYDLVGKSYCINNIQYTKEEYEKLQGHTSLDFGVFDEWNPEAASYNNEGCDNSCFVKNSSNCLGCFEVDGCNSLIDCQMIKPQTTDCIDATLILNSTRNREVMSTYAVDMGLFVTSCREGKNLLYCDMCYGSSDCFGCVGLRHKQYCIFNKQYTKEEYNIFVPKIVEHMRQTGEWGQFFDPSLSPFGYNKTLAHEYFPLKKNEAIALGYNWSDYEPPAPQSLNIISGGDLPDEISIVPDDIVKYAIRCDETGKLFKIQSKELDFYRKHGLPLPKIHPDVRHAQRVALRK